MKDSPGFITIRVDNTDYRMTRMKFDGIVTLFKKHGEVDWEKVFNWIRNNHHGDYVPQTEEELYG